MTHRILLCVAALALCVGIVGCSDSGPVGPSGNTTTVPAAPQFQSLGALDAVLDPMGFSAGKTVQLQTTGILDISFDWDQPVKVELYVTERPDLNAPFGCDPSVLVCDSIASVIDGSKPLRLTTPNSKPGLYFIHVRNRGSIETRGAGSIRWAPDR